MLLTNNGLRNTRKKHNGNEFNYNEGINNNGTDDKPTRKKCSERRKKLTGGRTRPSECGAEDTVSAKA